MQTDDEAKLLQLRGRYDFHYAVYAIRSTCPSLMQRAREDNNSEDFHTANFYYEMTVENWNRLPIDSLLTQPALRISKHFEPRGVRAPAIR